MSISVTPSATNAESHTPFSPKLNKLGKINTDAAWQRKVLKKEISKEIPPLESAVKNAEAKIFTPAAK